MLYNALPLSMVSKKPVPAKLLLNIYGFYIVWSTNTLEEVTKRYTKVLYSPTGTMSWFLSKVLEMKRISRTQIYIQALDPDHPKLTLSGITQYHPLEPSKVFKFFFISFRKWLPPTFSWDSLMMIRRVQSSLSAENSITDPEIWLPFPT